MAEDNPGSARKRTAREQDAQRSGGKKEFKPVKSDGRPPSSTGNPKPL
ncbi:MULTISPECIES: hypothetical protein [Hydrocarboniphaga]|uniref:Uncharacterized protein n=1 Tax=Hydrocarboniphaga effusa AP103 TaxID=1172194 RepID=I8HYS0_9GAMM|nr:MULTISPECIES: hypothetical protein [Hydrocarboniphaga]EIT68626.1 hypothetical protein WQQ_38210 [Hydrocarboniphaga effusa AP103]MDZ4077023.1 hypothetical protein [Hydrocarboniphaga sp.]